MITASRENPAVTQSRKVCFVSCTTVELTPCQGRGRSLNWSLVAGKSATTICCVMSASNASGSFLPTRLLLEREVAVGNLSGSKTKAGEVPALLNSWMERVSTDGPFSNGNASCIWKIGSRSAFLSCVSWAFGNGHHQWLPGISIRPISSARFRGFTFRAPVVIRFDRPNRRSTACTCRNDLAASG